ncbi:hypothetical protein AB0G74_07785 [Streptomyces sp. NPDC020875]|uniref:nitroreductase family protein n=1 Tax=Streptomyces sp. NPDC020875 TaxID=3154898 RepID=UPI0033C4B39F
MAAALAAARSARRPGPDLPYRAPAPARPDDGLPVPDALDPVLRHSVAGGRLRPAASAGALHPVSVRLLAGTGAGLPAGHYAYDPAAHRLHPVGPLTGPAPYGAFAILGAVPERTVSHYRHRAWPLTLLDTGHAVAALVAAGAPGYCLDPAPRSLPRPGRPGTGPDEIPLAVVRLTPHGELEDPPEGPPTATGAPSPAPHPDIADARRILRLLASSGRGTGTWYTARRRAARPVIEARRSAPVDVLATAGRPPDRLLRRVLTAARSAAPGGPDWWLAVGGTRPALLTDAPGGLRTEATGPVLDTLARWAAGQGWLAGTGAVLLAVGCPTAAAPARIRADHLRAGYGVGHAQLAATALGLPARPVGAWQRADLGAALGGPAGRRWIVHGLAFGTAPRNRPARARSGRPRRTTTA